MPLVDDDHLHAIGLENLPDLNDDFIVADENLGIEPDPIYLSEDDEAGAGVSVPVEAAPALGESGAKVFDRLKKVDGFSGNGTESIVVREADLAGFVLVVVDKAYESGVVLEGDGAARFVRNSSTGLHAIFLAEKAGGTVFFAAPESGLIAGGGSVLYFDGVREVVISNP
jgi:hypothetical protein